MHDYRRPLPNVWHGLPDAGSAYAENKGATSPAPSRSYVRILAAPLTILILPLTLFLWPRLSRRARVAGATCVVLFVALTIAQGVNRGVADISAYVVLFLVLVAGSSLVARAARRRDVHAVGIVVVVGCFLAYYVTTMNSRIEAEGRVTRQRRGGHRRAMRYTALNGVATIREDHLLMTWTPRPCTPRR